MNVSQKMMSFAEKILIHNFIIQIHTNRMTLSDDVSLEEYIQSKDELSGADIKVSNLISYVE